MEPLTIVFSVISATGAIVSIVCAILARIDKTKAKKSEAAAKEHAENANAANLEIQKYVQFLNAEVINQKSFIVEKDKVKQHLINYYKQSKKPVYGINQLHQNLYKNEGNKNLLHSILSELEIDGMIKPFEIDSTGKFDLFRILRDY